MGLACPFCECQESTLVVRTTDDLDGRKRYRKCVKCGLSFPTLERVDPKVLEKISQERKAKAPSNREMKNAVKRFKNLGKT